LLRQQLSFFGAPHVTLLFMPEWGNEREASDVGMFAQKLLMGLTAFGLAGLPQTLLGLYAPIVREVLYLPPGLKLLFGISFGYERAGEPGVRLQGSAGAPGGVGDVAAEDRAVVGHDREPTTPPPR